MQAGAVVPCRLGAGIARVDQQYGLEPCHGAISIFERRGTMMKFDTIFSNLLLVSILFSQIRFHTPKTIFYACLKHYPHPAL
jgi:hypothetical protein